MGVFINIIQAMLDQETSEADIDEIVSSEAVYRLSYDEDFKQLTVHFNSGSIYSYHGVSKQKADYFINTASSKGRYYVSRIRNNYIYTRVK